MTPKLICPPNIRLVALTRFQLSLKVATKLNVLHQQSRGGVVFNTLQGYFQGEEFIFS